MSENEKIRKVVEKYRKYFENSYTDIAQTEKGEWLFLEFDSKYRECYNVTRFKTAEELEDVFIKEMVNDIICSIEESVESCYFTFENKDKKEGNVDSISELLRMIELLCRESQQINQRFDIVVTCLSGVCSDREQK